VSRREVSHDVFVIGYSGGGSVVVNYGIEDFNYAGVVIEGRSARFLP
jgi:hypothetical protein